MSIQIAGRWLGDGWAVGCAYFKRIRCTSKSQGNGWQMAKRLPMAISKVCGCNSRSLQDVWEMIGWLAPTGSKDFCCICRSPRDGWEMAGWLALAIS